MYNAVIINVDELWLKGKNRPEYFKAQRRHLNSIAKLLMSPGYVLRNESQRYIITTEDTISDDTFRRFSNVPGINSVVPVRRVKLSEDAIMPAVVEELKSFDDLNKTFKVNTKRVNKKFPVGSMELSGEIGHLVLQEFPSLKVDVKKPEISIDLRILTDAIYISTKKIIGIGGLPVNTSGHLLTMLSGGFDSPVASFLMSKRGCKQTLAFFYSYPYVGEEVKEKIIEISKILGTFQNGLKLYIIPFGKVQNKIAQTCYDEYRTIFFRKYMVQVSNKLAKIVKAEALLTGDALAQVSSQTIGNIAMIDHSSRLPILRPLMGSNKMEIMNTARKIGTYDISVMPHDDACSMFAPKHPIIRPKMEYWEKYDQEHDFSEEVQYSIDNAEIISIDPIGQIIE